MKLRGRTKRQLVKVTALVMFAAIIITNTVPLFAEEEENNSPENEIVTEISEETGEGNEGDSADAAPVPEESAAAEEPADVTPEPEQGESTPEVAEPTEEPDSSPEVTAEPQETPEAAMDPAENPSVEPTAAATEEPAATAVPEESASPEKTAEEAPSIEPGASPSAEPAVTPAASPSLSPSPSISPSLSPSPSISPSLSPSPSISPSLSPSPSVSPSLSPSPSVSPSASPSAAPAESPEKAEAKIGSDGYSISGSGLKELTISFNTADLNSEDSFNLVLSTDADSVSVIGNTFSAKEDGRYEVGGVGKDALNITFGNLNEEEFTLAAEGTNVTFTYDASNELEETDEGFTGNAFIKASSEKEAEPEIKLAQKSIMTKTSDGAWVTVAGLLPEGVTVTAVPVNVEIEGKEVLAAYDITIWDAEGKEYKITEAVTVSISAPALKETEAEEVSVYHMENENAEAEKITDVGIDYNKVSFGAEGFSIYVIAADGTVTYGDENKAAINMNDPANMNKAEITAKFDIDASYSRNSEFLFVLDYVFKNDDHQPTSDNNVAYFTIPAELTGIMSSDRTISGITYSNDGKPIGTYTIEENKIIFTYDEEWLKTHTGDISGTFTFKAKISTSASQGEDQVVLNFGGTGNDITIQFDSGTIDGKKEHQILEDGTIDFVITLNVTGKNAEGVVLTDTLGSNLEFVEGSFYFENTEVSADAINILNKEATIGIGNLPIGTYQLKYKAKISDSADTSQTSNTVKWTWTANEEGKTTTDWVWFQSENISKSGTQENNRIKWVITVQPNAFSTVINKKVSDRLGDGHKYEGTYTIYRGDYWNNNVVKQGAIAEGATSFEYTFTEADIIDAKAGEKYTIVYYTIPDADIADGTKLINYLDDTPSEVTYTAEKMDIVSKSGRANNFESGASGDETTITWTITVDPLKYADTADKITNFTLVDMWNTGVYVENSLSIKDDDGSSLFWCSNYNVDSDNKTVTITFPNEIEKSKKIIISYETKGSAGTKATNTVHTTYTYGDKSNEEDDKSEITYTEKATMPFNKSGVLDGNEVEWTIVANQAYWGDNAESALRTETYTILDKLPDGMEYIEGTASYGVYPAEANIQGGLIAPSVSADGSLKFTFNESGEFNNAYYNGSGGWVYIILKFKTRITDFTSNENGLLNFTNNARIYKDSDKLGEDSAEVIIENTILDKEGIVNKGDNINRISYTISVNYAGADLNPYNDKLTLIDTLDVNTTLDINSIFVTDMNTGYPVDFAFSYDSTGEQGRFTLEIPDKQALKVTYEVSVAGAVGQTITVNNKAELGGIANSTSSEENQVKIIDSSSVANGKTGSIKISKYDNDTHKPLAGATFALYRYGDDAEVDVQTTAEDGTITFEKDKTSEAEDQSLVPDRVYYYKETQAPEGYILDEATHYFIIKGVSYQEVVAKLPANIRIHISEIVGGNTFLIPNEAKLGSLVIKKSFGVDTPLTEEEKRAISFTVTGPDDYSKTFTLAQMTDGSLTLENLPEGTYTVTEKNAGKTGYILETAYKVDGTDSLNAQALVSKGNTSIIELINSYVQDTGSLTVTKSFGIDTPLTDEEKNAIIFTVTGLNYSKSFTYADMTNGSYTLENLEYGTYIVEEKNGIKEGYQLQTVYAVGDSEPGEAVASVIISADNQSASVKVTNTYISYKTSVSVKKVWDDANNQDGKRPESINVVLKNGDKAVQTVVLNEANNWKETIEGLDEYTAGVKNVYSWSEDTAGLPEGYSLTGQSTEGSVTTITNSYTPGKVSATVKKVWNDANNQDGKRPGDISVELKNGDNIVQTVVLNEANNWQETVNDLDEYTSGVKNVYSWSEDAAGLPEGYSLTGQSTEGSVTTITNSYTPGKVSATVKKVWDDANNQDGKRPEDISVELKNGDKTVQTVVLNEANNWQETVNDLAEYTAGVKNVYSWSEDTTGLPEGYSLTGQSTEGSVTTITNSYTPGKVSATVKKVWDDANNQDGKRPEDISVELKNGDKTVQTVVLNEANKWQATVNDLAEYTSGVKNVYSWSEDTTGLPEGYSLTGQSTEGSVTTITNSYTPGKVSATVKKVWDDANNQDGKRPEDISVELKNGDKTVQTVVLNEENKWQVTVSELDEYTSGVKNVYSWSEDATGLPEGYSLTGQSTEGSVTTITNSYTPGKVEATVKKVWDDANNQDGKRPGSISVVLKNGDKAVQIVVLNESNGWETTVKDLAEYTAGVKNVYSWSEDTTGLPEGYSLKKQETVGTVTTISNSYTPGKVEATVKKVWDDTNDQDNKRPENISVVLKNGNEIVQTVVLNESNGWKTTVKDLAEYTAGVKNIYSWSEDTTGLPEGYSLKKQETIGTVTTITNSYTPGKVSATVKKVWNDAENQDGKRPESISVVLKNGDEAVQMVTLNESNKWQATVSDLDEYTSGVKNVYTWSEDVTGLPEGYKLTGQSTEGSITTIINSYTPGKVSATVKKVWEDGENQDGKRPGSINVELKNGDRTVQTVILSEANGWEATVDGLDEYTSGVKNIYTWSEDATGLPEGYNLKGQSTEGSITTITNTYTPGKVEATVKKVWDDTNNQDGKRPESINVVLKNGDKIVKTVILNEVNNWETTVKELDEYTSGVKNIYTWLEDAAGLPEGYSLTSQETIGTVTTITNRYAPGKVSAIVKKVWEDEENQDGKRPESISVVLKNGDKVVQTIVLNEANRWQATVNDLDEYTAGIKNVYAWSEDTTGLPEGYNLTGQITEGSITTITNSYIPGKVSATVKKVWDDANNQDGKRPGSISVELKNGDRTVQTVILSEANGWEATVDGLDEYTAGVKNIYTWSEDATGLPEGYALKDQSTEGIITTLTNGYTPETIDIEGSKTWDDNNNEYEERPEKITINLLANGVQTQSKDVTEGDNWSWSFTDLPKYDENGDEIKYTISEGDIRHYTANVTGFDVTNKYTPEETEVKVTKVWEDNDDEDGIRPAKIMVQLYEDRLFDKKVGDSVELSVENGWTYVWTKLPRTKMFGNINYTVKELGAVDAEGNVIDIEGYICTISEDTTNNIIITNSHEPEPQPTPTPTATPSATPASTPTATPTGTPTATPSVTPTGTPTATPSVTPAGTPTATPSVTPAGTPTATPNATPEETPTATPEETPAETPTATPEATPDNTPEVTPESTPVPSEAPAATPESTPVPEETPAPADEPEIPDNGPETTPETRPENTPAPTPVRQVLGASRVRIKASEGAVLGARRGLDCAVLGKRRRPGTGDSANIIMWVLVMAAAAGGILTSIIMLITGRKRKNS